MNCVARGLPRDGLAERLAPVSRRLSLRAGVELSISDTIYFPVDGIATIALEREGARFQIGFAGRGDVIGLQRLFTAAFPPMRAEVLKPGHFICLSTKTLSEIMNSDPKLKDHLAVYALRAAARFLDEAAEAVVLTLERRVARWIARYQTTLGGDLISVTHHGLSRALGVRRSGVTVALHVLEGQHLIRSKRGRIEIRDPVGLMAFGQIERSHRPAEIAPPVSSQRAKSSMSPFSFNDADRAHFSRASGR